MNISSIQYTKYIEILYSHLKNRQEIIIIKSSCIDITLRPDASRRWFKPTVDDECTELSNSSSR